MKLAIYCAGGLGKEMLAFTRSISRWDEILFVDDVTDATDVHGARVLRFEDVTAFGGDVEFIIASGEPAGRKTLFEKIKAAGYRLATVISPWATVSPGATLGEGCIVLDSVASVDVTVCENVMINSRVIIGHDAVVGAHSVLSANCFLGGKARLGECVYMAPGSMTKDRVMVGDSAIVSLGAVVLRNVRPNAIMLGNPARRLADNGAGKVFDIFDDDGN